MWLKWPYNTPHLSLHLVPFLAIDKCPLAVITFIIFCHLKVAILNKSFGSTTTKPTMIFFHFACINAIISWIPKFFLRASLCSFHKLNQLGEKQQWSFFSRLCCLYLFVFFINLFLQYVITTSLNIPTFLGSYDSTSFARWIKC